MKNKKQKQGFTLVELLLVIAIIAILSGVVMVSLSAQKDKANATKALAELSGVIQPMLMCWADDGSVALPTAEVPICNLDDAYGSWPILPGKFEEYKSTDTMENGDWAFWVDDGTARICCSSTLSGCEEIETDAVCN